MSHINLHVLLMASSIFPGISNSPLVVLSVYFITQGYPVSGISIKTPCLAFRRKVHVLI